jgi:hypothetical protein
MSLKLNLSSKKLVLGLAALAVVAGEAVLDSMLGLPHADLLVKATVTLGLGGVGAQSAIDLLKEFMSGTGKPS